MQAAVAAWPACRAKRLRFVANCFSYGGSSKRFFSHSSNARSITRRAVSPRLYSDGHQDPLRTCPTSWSPPAAKTLPTRDGQPWTPLWSSALKYRPSAGCVARTSARFWLRRRGRDFSRPRVLFRHVAQTRHGSACRALGAQGLDGTICRLVIVPQALHSTSSTPSRAGWRLCRGSHTTDTRRTRMCRLAPAHGIPPDTSTHAGGEYPPR